MPIFQIGLEDGRSLRIEADDQAAALAGVQHFQDSSKAPAEKPSGIGEHLVQGISGVIGGPAKTLGLAGIPTGPMDKAAAAVAPKDFKAAQIFDKDWGFHPGNIPAAVAGMAPGLAVDMGAAKLAPGGALGKAATFAGSMLLRNFGPGAHEKADARTGAPNSPVEGSDLGREGLSQAAQLVPNMFLGGRMAPGATKALAEGALTKLGKTSAIGGAVSGYGDAVNQVSTKLGTDEKIDFPQMASSAVTGAATVGGMKAPKALAEGAANFKYRKTDSDPDTRAAATDYANKITEAADGKKLVSLVGSTKHAEDVKSRVDADIHKELSEAIKGETDLSQGSTNTLSRIQKGLGASPKEIKTLADEAGSDTVSLARQALHAADLKAKGGLSGMMEKSVKAVANPVGAATVAGSSALAGAHGVLGSVGLPVLGAIAGGYGLARVADKLTGNRSPINRFTDRYADPEAPSRTPAIGPPVDAVDPYNPSAGPWGARLPSSGPTGPRTALEPPAPAPLNATALNADIRGMLTMAAARRKAEGIAQAESIAAESPLIQAQGGLDALNNPAQTKHGAGLIRAASVMRKLTEQPEESGPVTPVTPQSLVNTETPASPAIGDLLTKLRAKGAVPKEAPPAPVAPEAPMADPMGPPVAEAPVGPVMARISKKSGERVKQEQAEESGYTPMGPEQLWGRGIANDRKFAEMEASNTKGLKDPDRYIDGVVRDRQKRRGIATDILGDNPSEKAQEQVANLLEELHHTRRRSKAEGAIKHFTSDMEPGLKTAFRKRMDKSFINDMWSI